MPIDVGRVETRTHAKLNLSLRITGRRADGYHELDSLVAFLDVGDRLTAGYAAEPGLTFCGPFAQTLGEGRNLVLRGCDVFRPQRPVGFQLEKNLPVASGLGGGSGDAAAALRLLNRLENNRYSETELAVMAQKIGADVAVCLQGRACRMRGIGERIDPLAGFPEVWALLVNPGIACDTASVFDAYRMANNGFSTESVMPEFFGSADALIDFLTGEPNDLQPAAVSLHPAIAPVLARLSARHGCRLARMSGSGATCFGLFESESCAMQAENAFAGDGWTAVGRLH